MMRGDLITEVQVMSFMIRKISKFAHRFARSTPETSLTSTMFCVLVVFILNSYINLWMQNKHCLNLIIKFQSFALDGRVIVIQLKLFQQKWSICLIQVFAMQVLFVFMNKKSDQSSSCGVCVDQCHSRDSINRIRMDRNNKKLIRLNLIKQQTLLQVN